MMDYHIDRLLLLVLLLQAAFLAMKSTGGKLLVFQSGKVLSAGALSNVQVQACASKINCILSVCLH